MTMFRERESFGPTTFIALQPGMRRKIERTIECLVDLLDGLDGDTDLEEQGEDEGAQCEDEGAQCEDEGEIDTGIGDGEGLGEHLSGYLPGQRFE